MRCRAAPRIRRAPTFPRPVGGSRLVAATRPVRAPRAGGRAARPRPQAGPAGGPRPGRRADHPRRPGAARRGARCARPRRTAPREPDTAGCRHEPVRFRVLPPAGAGPRRSAPRPPPAALPPTPEPSTRAAAPGRRARGRRARPRRRLPARVRVLRRPDPRRRRQQPGRADLLRRRQPAHPARARAGQPDGRPGRPGAPVRPGGRAGGGGPVVLLQPRFRPDRHRARRVQPAARRCRRWLDDHAAVRQEHPRRRRGDAVAQVPGDGPRGQDLPGAQQGRDPRRLPQRDLLRAGRLRDPVGRPRLLRQVGDRAHPGRGRAARGVDPVTVALGPRAQPGQGRAALDLRPRRHGRPGLALPGRARRGRLPADRTPQAVDGRHPGRRPGARRHGGPGRARGPGHHRAGR